MLKSQLKLQEPLEPEEVDVGDLHSGDQTGGLLSTTSSAFASPAGISPGPSRPARPSNYKPTPISTALPRKTSLGNLTSPSTPDVSHSKKIPRPVALSRSQTLPRVFQIEQRARRRNFEVDDLAVDPVAVAKMRRWILGVAIVDFDLDQGPVISGIYPPLILFPAESENIAFSSFPDSLQFDQGSQVHSFRIREHMISLPNDKRPASKDGFIYGYSHFTQRRDTNSKRGYQQRSLVILTHHQYPALFSALLSIFGPLFQTHDVPMLEAACHNIATWPDPTPGITTELGFLGSVIPVELPHAIDEQQLTETSSFKEKYDPRLHVLASSSPFLPPPLALFEASLSHLWSIWECLVLCEPILVFGSSPAMTSQAIWWFRDLLRPIPLASDIRPYFTIHDGDHSLLVNKLPPKAGILLGVTNPFFERSCAHWPHILSLGQRAQVTTSAKPSPSVNPAGPAPGWKTRTHKRFISKDRALLKQLEDACKSSERIKMEASLILRRHFCSRTTELLLPLARYLNTLIPSPAEVTSARSSNNTLRLKPFNSLNFFASLKAHGCTLPFRSTSKKMEFYERWLRTPAFGLWLARQEEIVQGVLRENVQRASPYS